MDDLNNVPQQYLAAASGPAQHYLWGGLSQRRFRLATGEAQQLVQLLASDDWIGLSLKGSHPTYQVLDNCGEHWGNLTIRGNLIEVDSSPAHFASRPRVAEAVFWIRLGTALYLRYNVTEA